MPLVQHPDLWSDLQGDGFDSVSSALTTSLFLPVIPCDVTQGFHRNKLPLKVFPNLFSQVPCREQQSTKGRAGSRLTKSPWRDTNYFAIMFAIQTCPYVRAVQESGLLQ